MNEQILFKMIQENDEVDTKKINKRIANRLSAKKSRENRKKILENLQIENAKLKKELNKIRHLNIQNLQEENKKLKQYLNINSDEYVQTLKDYIVKLKDIILNQQKQIKGLNELVDGLF
ncbi:putative bZIP transcription factor [Aureococcus anophagefferens virus]|uniref:Putative bZIP transcription factor n=1 Tax=Aureococcus anophagefferens virus TaxID=1474867 RepID=A0A076FMH6_9VIRU|nr:putative bZIP transcription factor [Aureococcus anophagefferens virus]AII17113.1 putative bZIP transcription factor [Aureococcus anophagefferens virus]UOG94222.1 hypothetical protein MKD35_181 [Aureococcus anophagefferens virus]